MRIDDPIAVLMTLNGVLANRFDLSQTGYSVPDFVRDYIERNEAQIALELLMDQICEFAIGVSEGEYQTLRSLAVAYHIQDRKALTFIKDKLLI